MIKITKTAQQMLLAQLNQAGPNLVIRMIIQGNVPGAYVPELVVVCDDDISERDIRIRVGNLQIFLRADDLPKAQGLNIDTIQTIYGPRLKFEFPSPVWDDPIANCLQTLIDQRINPGLNSHGGYIALLGVENGTAEIIMGGGCQGCGFSSQTMSDMIAVLIKKEIPEIKEVVDCTDHNRGADPYYRSADHAGLSRNQRRKRARRKKT